MVDNEEVVWRRNQARPMDEETARNTLSPPPMYKAELAHLIASSVSGSEVITSSSKRCFEVNDST